MVLAPTRAIVQIRGMRWLPILAVLAGSAGAEPRASNPAFLGIGLQDTPVGCMATRVLGAGPAKDAGIHDGDLILAFDGKALAGTPVGPCSTLQALIIARAPGDTIRLDIRRGLDALAIHVALSTRAEVAHRRFVGHRFTATLEDADDPRRTHDIDDLRGRPVVLGLFHADGCVGCAAVFDRLRDGLRERLGGDNLPEIFAVTPENKQSTTPLAKLFNSSVPLATGPTDLFLQGDLFETDRIYFLIIDTGGIVRSVSPIAPDSDDLDAALDEVLAAVEQQQDHVKSRR